MSLLSRFFDGAEAHSELPESMQRIVAELENFEEDRAHFLAAFAYLLARVAHADMEVDATEVAEMERTLVRAADLPESEARLVVQIAVYQAGAIGGTDDYLVTRELRKMTEKAERVRLMRCVLAVAAADDSITSIESREVLAIGEELGFTRPEINGLRLEYRDKLSELQKLDGER